MNIIHPDKPLIIITVYRDHFKMRIGSSRIPIVYPKHMLESTLKALYSNGYVPESLPVTDTPQKARPQAYVRRKEKQQKQTRRRRSRG